MRSCGTRAAGPRASGILNPKHGAATARCAGRSARSGPGRERRLRVCSTWMLSLLVPIWLWKAEPEAEPAPGREGRRARAQREAGSVCSRSQRRASNLAWDTSFPG